MSLLVRAVQSVARSVGQLLVSHPFTRLLARLAWSMVKRVLHAASGLSEIERICSTHPPTSAGGGGGAGGAAVAATAALRPDGSGAAPSGLPPHTPAMTLAFYASVVSSRQLRSAAGTLSSATTAAEVPALVQDILAIKRPRLTLPLRRRGHRREQLPGGPDIEPNVVACVAHVLAANAFRSALAAAAATPYDSGRPAHESALVQLWAHMKPGVPLPERKGIHWADIGFQGVDPASDFRSGGELALRSLEWMARERGEVARGMLSAMGEVAGGRPSSGGVAWYPWACAGIQIVHEVRGLAEARLLDGVWYRTLASAAAAPRNGSTGGASDPWAAQEQLTIAFYEIVAEVWVLFHGLWGASVSPGSTAGSGSGGGGSVLDYPRVFAAAMVVVKERLQARGSLAER